ncbi:MAG: hypothetical protein GX113_00490 [Actinobacteria bacterium]|nr:hypothetical protein [Actinomycetota bacterium]
MSSQDTSRLGEALWRIEWFWLGTMCIVGLPAAAFFIVCNVHEGLKTGRLKGDLSVDTGD